MFVIFDRISNEPFIVKISSDHSMKGDIADRAIMLLSSHEEGVEALRSIFGDDDDWNLSRFAIHECERDQRFHAFVLLRAKVDLFCDKNGNLLSEKEIYPFIGIKEENGVEGTSDTVQWPERSIDPSETQD
jgi:hypothetical protein